MIAPEWTSAIGVAVALSFALGAPLNTARYAVFTRLSNHLARLGCTPVQADDEPLEPLGAEIMVFGMGRVGVGAFDGLATCRGDRILGADRNERIVRMNAAEGRQMIRGDALDTEFWERLQLDQRIDLVVLAMDDHTANLEAVRRVKDYLPNTRIAAIASLPTTSGNSKRQVSTSPATCMARLARVLPTMPVICSTAKILVRNARWEVHRQDTRPTDLATSPSHWFTLGHRELRNTFHPNTNCGRHFQTGEIRTSASMDP